MFSKTSAKPHADLSREKAHFPFLKLPAEIRNMIYKLTLVTDSWVMISDMSPPDFECLQDSRHPLQRTPYLMNVHDAEYCEETSVQPYNCTTYGYKWCHCEGKINGISLLSVCRQVNTEAVPILYGRNKFALRSAQAIIPFLQDRPFTSLAQIKRVRLSFISAREGAKRRHLVWTSALDYIGQHLRLETLDLELCFTTKTITEIEFRNSSMRWIESLMSITELETLNIKLDFYVPFDATFSPRHTARNEDFKPRFIEYLKSEMLKSKVAASTPRLTTRNETFKPRYIEYLRSEMLTTRVAASITQV